jgi:hypothetical protein
VPAFGHPFTHLNRREPMRGFASQCAPQSGDAAGHDADRETSPTADDNQLEISGVGVRILPLVLAAEHSLMGHGGLRGELAGWAVDA